MASQNPEQWLFLKRTVRFGETDAAGVIHFQNLLRWSHEAWEESLERYGLPASDVFPNLMQNEISVDVALPIVHCSADFRAPIHTGEHLEVILAPEKIGVGSFQVKSNFQRAGKNVACGLIRHLAINAETSQRCALPEGIDLWLEASTVKLGPRPF